MIWYPTAPVYRPWGSYLVPVSTDPPAPSRYRTGSKVTDYTGIATLLVLFLVSH